MSRTTPHNAWLTLFVVLVFLASTNVVHAATVTVTLKNGTTYEVKTDRRGEPVGAENRQVEILFLGASTSRSPSSDTPAYEWTWQLRLKRKRTFSLTVTTPIDETVSTSFEVVGRGVATGSFFNSDEYPTLWAWLSEPETTWVPFVFSFEDTQSNNTFELTQWLRFDAPGKVYFVKAAYAATGLLSPDQHPNNETVTPPFDDRDWELGYRSDEGDQVVQEYVLSGETVENWSELITVQSFFDPRDNTAPEYMMRGVKDSTLQDCPDAMWNTIRVSETEALYEWRTEGCQGPVDSDDQYEIDRIIKGSSGIHRIAYTTKRQPNLPETVRTEWIDRIGRAEVYLPEQTSNSGTETTQDDLEGTAGVQGAVASTYSEATTELLSEPTQSVSVNDTALVYILRDSSNRLRKVFDLFMDETPIVSLPRSSYTTVVASPGWHLMWGDVSSGWFEFKAGREYLLRILPDGAWMIGDSQYIAQAVLRLGLALVVPTENSLVELRENLDKYSKVRRRAGDPYDYPIEYRALTYKEEPPGAFADYQPFQIFGLGKKSTLTITETAISYQSKKHELNIPMGDILSASLHNVLNEAWIVIRYREQDSIQDAYFGAFYNLDAYNRMMLAFQNSKSQKTN